MGHREQTTLSDFILQSPLGTAIAGILSIVLGIFFCIITTYGNAPIPREEALSYSGQFDRYATSKNYCTIWFEDETCYEVYPHTESREFRQVMETLPKGTTLYLLVNPHNDCVVEVKTNTEELLNFESSQQAIDNYDNGYVWIGGFVAVGGVFLIAFALGMKNNAKKESARHKAKKSGTTTPLYLSDPLVKARILLEARAEGYHICYRRVKTTNELVINGQVYDKKKALIEFEHKLTATVGEHTFEAGYNQDGYSYITFDNRLLKEKKRYI